MCLARFFIGGADSRELEVARFREDRLTFAEALRVVHRAVGRAHHGGHVGVTSVLNVPRALQHFRAVNASDEIARQMGIAPHDALLLITRVGYTAEQRAIELTTDTYCCNDYYDFVAELHK